MVIRYLPVYLIPYPGYLPPLILGSGSGAPGGVKAGEKELVSLLA